ncbi:MAG TPA: ATP-binding protein [Flavobacterium sp.]|jgi:PAS domain S-box-containing protein|nr:ATP-binding protein [Flavobacterium sp.]
MTEKLHVLVAEDSESDVDLLQHALRKSDFDIEYRFVDRKADFIKALTEYKADLIICDHTLPEFDSIEAIAMCKTSDYKGAFILVTGTVSEEFAAKCISMGADDYVLKSNLVRLPSAISNALKKKKAESDKQNGLQKLADSEEKYRHLFNYNPMPMWIIDKTTTDFLQVNEAAIKHYGYSRNEFLSMKHTDICLNSAVCDDLKRKGQIGAYMAGVMQHSKKDGRRIYVEITVDDVATGDTEGQLILANDITDKTLATQQLEQQNAELLKINAELDRFVYSVSHELRAPITNMMGLIHVLKDDAHEDEHEMVLDVLHSRVDKLDEVIKDILTYSRNARSGMVAELIDFSEMVKECVENNSYLNGFANINIITDIDCKHGAWSDKSRLSVVLNNIFRNAVIYHNLQQEKPFIRITACCSQDHIKIEVEDNGVGIDQKHVDNIFKMFYRASATSEGSGLGLYMVREIVEKLSGKVRVESTIGHGTKFTINLPNAGS